MGHEVTPETREKLRLASVRRYGKTHLKHATKPELLAMLYLIEENIKYLPQHIIDDKFVVDFFLPERNTVVEMDGYWHKTRPQRDDERAAALQRLGYTVVRIPCPRNFVTKEAFLSRIRLSQAL